MNLSKLSQDDLGKFPLIKEGEVIYAYTTDFIEMMLVQKILVRQGASKPAMQQK